MTEPTELRFAVTITATAEVRDKDGTLVSSQPVEQTVLMSRDEIDQAFGGEH